MAEGKGGPVISLDNIQVRSREVKLQSMGEVSAHVGSRSPLFISRLASITLGSKHGWERIIMANKHVAKIGVDKPKTRDLFTGTMLCAVAARGLRDGLVQALGEGSSLQVDLVEATGVDMDVENRGKPHHAPRKGEHYFVRVAGGESGESRYFDAAYGQIDHRESGRIMDIPESEVEQRYGIKSEEIRKHTDDATDIEVFEKVYKPKLQISNEGYDALVRTITDAYPVQQSPSDVHRS